MSARDDYPHLAEAWGADTARALDEIDNLRAEVTRLHSLIVRLGVAPQPGYVGPTVF